MGEHGGSVTDQAVRASLVAELERAREACELVRVSRSIPRVDRFEGYVTGVGRSWVSFATLGFGFVLDGWTLFRLKDMRKVVGRKGKSEPPFEQKVLMARSQWPPPVLQVNLDRFADVIESVTAVSQLLTVEMEYAKPDASWVGSVCSVDDTTLSLLEVEPDAMWRRAPRLFDAEDITRVAFGSAYEEALQLVAGPVQWG